MSYPVNAAPTRICANAMMIQGLQEQSRFFRFQSTLCSNTTAIASAVEKLMFLENLDVRAHFSQFG